MHHFITQRSGLYWNTMWLKVDDVSSCFFWTIMICYMLLHVCRETTHARGGNHEYFGSVFNGRIQISYSRILIPYWGILIFDWKNWFYTNETGQCIAWWRTAAWSTAQTCDLTHFRFDGETQCDLTHFPPRVPAFHHFSSLFAFLSPPFPWLVPKSVTFPRSRTGLWTHFRWTKRLDRWPPRRQLVPQWYVTLLVLSFVCIYMPALDRSLCACSDPKAQRWRECSYVLWGIMMCYWKTLNSCRKMMIYRWKMLFLNFKKCCFSINK